MHEERPKEERLKKIFTLIESAPQPNDQYEAFRLLKKSFQEVEAFELKGQMTVLPFDSWQSLESHAMRFDRYKKHIVFISLQGDILVLNFGLDDKVYISPKDHPLFFYNLARKEERVAFSKMHPGCCWERNKN